MSADSDAFNYSYVIDPRIQTPVEGWCTLASSRARERHDINGRANDLRPLFLVSMITPWYVQQNCVNNSEVIVQEDRTCAQNPARLVTVGGPVCGVVPCFELAARSVEVNHSV